MKLSGKPWETILAHRFVLFFVTGIDIILSRLFSSSHIFITHDKRRRYLDRIVSSTIHFTPLPLARPYDVVLVIAPRLVVREAGVTPRPAPLPLVPLVVPDGAGTLDCLGAGVFGATDGFRGVGPDMLEVGLSTKEVSVVLYARTVNVSISKTSHIRHPRN